jgi:hypothetical protein
MVEKEFPFCSNPDCVLYVRAGDPGVLGSGNWAELPTVGSWVAASIAAYICAIRADESGIQSTQFD